MKGRTVDLVRAFFTRIKQRMLGKSAYPLARVLHEIKNDLKKTFSKEELDSFVMQVGMIEITQIIRGVMPSWAIQTSSLFASFARPSV